MAENQGMMLRQAQQQQLIDPQFMSNLTGMFTGAQPIPASFNTNGGNSQILPMNPQQGQQPTVQIVHFANPICRNASNSDIP
ncbi:MAG: hypothetical protein V4597_15935 [Pseudomonadota bacterium]